MGASYLVARSPDRIFSSIIYVPHLWLKMTKGSTKLSGNKSLHKGFQGLQRVAPICLQICCCLTKEELQSIIKGKFAEEGGKLEKRAKEKLCTMTEKPTTTEKAAVVQRKSGMPLAAKTVGIARTAHGACEPACQTTPDTTASECDVSPCVLCGTEPRRLRCSWCTSVCYSSCACQRRDQFWHITPLCITVVLLNGEEEALEIQMNPRHTLKDLKGKVFHWAFTRSGFQDMDDFEIDLILNGIKLHQARSTLGWHGVKSGDELQLMGRIKEEEMPPALPNNRFRADDCWTDDDMPVLADSSDDDICLA